MVSDVAVISLAEVRKAYGSHLAVDWVSFEVRKGEVFGLLGPNGAGKSTTIAMMSGLFRPDSGAVRIGQSDPADPRTRMGIGLAPQAPSLFERLTGEENLRFFAQI